MAGWTAYARESQLLAIGRHLAKCPCAGEPAREVIRLIHDGLEPWRE